MPIEDMCAMSVSQFHFAINALALITWKMKPGYGLRSLNSEKKYSLNPVERTEKKLASVTSYRFMPWTPKLRLFKPSVAASHQDDPAAPCAPWYSCPCVIPPHTVPRLVCVGPTEPGRRDGRSLMRFSYKRVKFLSWFFSLFSLALGATIW